MFMNIKAYVVCNENIFILLKNSYLVNVKLKKKNIYK